MALEAVCRNWRFILRREFAGDDEGFISRLQQDVIWDRESFREMVIAMREACLLYAADEELERWVAHGFFYVPAFVRGWTNQPEFPRPEANYWRGALAVLEELSHWYFWGDPPSDVGDIDSVWFEDKYPFENECAI